ncbi:MAG: hypothetical protein BJ554DRAFT_6679 [Olpidium bornovanus]|uniref:Uncharacterized protein n=1 Tax=Olpidium bornovanus TaxID=278681 RepID=A0A8H8A2L9_9FUNG|nr:MAG: hypothetical protein BJ554DRAFT_6679 [Olpidium bornovanus]
MTSYTESNTYLSRDAGNTWTKIRDGESHWGIGDSGGILVVVDDEAPTTEVSEQPVRVALIAIEPTWRSTSFLILGKLLPPDTSDARTVVVHLDFSGVFDRKCDVPGCNAGLAGEGDLSTVASTSADFEKWHPTASQCQMGHEVVFWRRKQDSACFVGEKLVNVKVERKNCECTKDDFEWYNAIIFVGPKFTLLGLLCPRTPF